MRGGKSLHLLTHGVWRLNQICFHREKRQWLQQFRRNEHLSRDELDELTWKKQKRLLEHAFYNVPFYQKFYTDAGFHPQDIKNREDFATVPLLTKEMLRENLEEMRACGVDKRQLRESRTSGSTAEPLKVYHDANNEEMLSAARARILRWWGLRATARVINLWRVDNLSKTIVQDDNKSWLRRTLSLSPVTFNALAMSQDSMEQYVRCLNHIRPDILLGYVGALDTLAAYIEHKPSILTAKLKAVWATASPLGVHEERRMERVFGAPVYDQYGSCEIYYLAAECRAKEGLHAFADIRHITCVDTQGKPTAPDTVGEIVVTDLHNYAAPLIQYRIGDMGSYRAQGCSCGNVLPLMHKISGRVTDMILLPDGSKVAGHGFSSCFAAYVDEVANFQVHQKAMDLICVKMVMRNPKAFNDIKMKLEEYFVHFTKGLIVFHFEKVDSIMHDRGKYRHIISDVKE
jgi:phenylacetate-coenzyme A ligase PaaK-like adenylate-forming protein